MAALSAKPIAVLKPEYLTVTKSGRVVQENAADSPCNGFSTTNLATVRTGAHSVVVTVSSSAGTARLLGTVSNRAAAKKAIVKFVTKYRLNGVDLDFEPNSWSRTTWASYMGFVRDVSAALRPAGRTVDVDLVAFTSKPWDAQRYADVVKAGARLVVMAYDKQYETPCGPIAPLNWIRDVVAYATSQVPLSRLTIGLPSYSYYATSCTGISGMIGNLAYTTMRTKNGFPTTDTAVAAARDPASGELRWVSGGVHYDVIDYVAMKTKLQTVQNLGVRSVSVWSLGGNPWFDANLH